MSFYSEDEMKSLGLRKFGKGVRLSRKASIYNASNIEIGDHSRIDDFCVLSAGDAGIVIGRHVHVAINSSLIGKAKIEIADYSNLSSRVSVYSSNDDYSGEYMTNPTIPTQYTNVTHAAVRIEKHVIVGSGSIILPGVTLKEGSGVGALSLVRDDCEPFVMYGGVPARKIGIRKRNVLTLEKKMAETGL